MYSTGHGAWKERAFGDRLARITLRNQVSNQWEMQVCKDYHGDCDIQKQHLIVPAFEASHS